MIEPMMIAAAPQMIKKINNPFSPIIFLMILSFPRFQINGGFRKAMYIQKIP